MFEHTWNSRLKNGSAEVGKSERQTKRSRDVRVRNSKEMEKRDLFLCRSLVLTFTGPASPCPHVLQCPILLLSKCPFITPLVLEYFYDFQPEVPIKDTCFMQIPHLTFKIFIECLLCARYSVLRNQSLRNPGNSQYQQNEPSEDYRQFCEARAEAAVKAWEKESRWDF